MSVSFPATVKRKITWLVITAKLLDQIAPLEEPAAGSAAHPICRSLPHVGQVWVCRIVLCASMLHLGEEC